MQPLDPNKVHYGNERMIWDMDEIQPELIPDKVRQLRWKLYQKAKKEPKFRFYALYDRVYRFDVLEAAFKHVAKRGKAAGIDGVRAETILDEEGGVQRFLRSIQEELKQKQYCPSPVKRVFIPKGDGGKRPLGIPTLKDRVVQMAVALLLIPIFEADFLDCSYGFRPNRSAHDALGEIREHIKSGKTSVYDADLKGYFDSIPHDKLMACVKMRVVDRNVLRLIRVWLKAPIIEQDEDGKRKPPRKNDKGTPQGGVISPLLANIYLHWFDKVFHFADGPFNFANARLVRYADDLVVLANQQGKGLEKWITDKLENWLGLKINHDKTKVVELTKGDSLDFLGFTFRYVKPLNGGPKKYLNLEPSEKSLFTARVAIRQHTSPTMCYKPTEAVVKDLNRYLTGWKQYYDFGYPRRMFRKMNHFVNCRMMTHLNRRSQRKSRKPDEVSYYKYLNDLGLQRL